MRFPAPTKNAIPAAEARRSAKNSAMWSSLRPEVLPREERHGEADAAEDDLRERGPAVAVEGARDDRLAVGRVDVEPDRGDEAAEEAELGDDPAERPPVPRRDEHRAEERDERRARGARGSSRARTSRCAACGSWAERHDRGGFASAAWATADERVVADRGRPRREQQEPGDERRERARARRAARPSPRRRRSSRAPRGGRRR